MSVAGQPSPRTERPPRRRWVRGGIGLLRGVAYLLLVAGVWGVPITLALFASTSDPAVGWDPDWAWAVVEVAIATLGLSMVTWWVVDWLEDEESSGH